MADLRAISGDVIRAMSRAERRELFDRVCRELRGPLVGRVQAIVRDWATAEDIAQDTLLKLYRQLERPQPPIGPLVPWLWRVAFNAAMTELKRRRTQRLVPVEDAAGVTGDEPEIVESDDLLARAMQAAAALPEKQRMAFEAMGRDGMKASEAAQGLGWPETSVRNNFSRALQRIRASLAPHSAEE